MLRTFGTFLRGAQPVTTAAVLRRRTRGVCYSYSAIPEGAMTGPKAKVGQPAPHWRGKAVVQDEIKEIQLDDYKARCILVIGQAHLTCLVSRCLVVK